MRGLHRLERVVMPLWLATPLTGLGVLFLLFGHSVGVSWADYGAALAAAVLVGVVTARRYEVEVVERSENGVVIRFRRRQRPT